jgi:hypothetical protein
MIREETVFILGAGASWHYGYPTGEGLIENVIKIAIRFRDHCSWRLKSGNMPVQYVPNYVNARINNSLGVTGARNGWIEVRDECQLLIGRLNVVRPLVIDYFPAWNESLRPIGKLMIAAAILECEALSIRSGANQNRNPSLIDAPGKPDADNVKVGPPKYSDDWYRFIVHKLVYGCTKSGDLFKNNVRFGTFNYDTSLEYQLFYALSSIDLFDQNDIMTFLGDARIVHVYGAVHKDIPCREDAINLKTAQELGYAPTGVTQEWLENTKSLLDKYLMAAESLLTIDPHDKEEDKTSLELARNWINKSVVAYILGYGFDANNSRRIGLEQLLKSAGRTVMFTNFGDRNTINKKASNLFFNDPSNFLDSAIVGTVPGKSYYAEKSVRTVYEALERDFDAVEE